MACRLRAAEWACVLACMACLHGGRVVDGGCPAHGRCLSEVWRLAALVEGALSSVGSRAALVATARRVVERLSSEQREGRAVSSGMGRRLAATLVGVLVPVGMGLRELVSMREAEDLSGSISEVIMWWECSCPTATSLQSCARMRPFIQCSVVFQWRCQGRAWCHYAAMRCKCFAGSSRALVQRVGCLGLLWLE